MVFYILPSNEEAIIHLTDLYRQYLLLPSFDLQQSMTKTIHEKYALSLWIQMICLHEITNQEIIDQFLSEYSMITSSIDIVNKALESENFIDILNCRSLIRELYSHMYREWHLQYCIVHGENSPEIATSLVAYYIDNISLDQLRLFEANVGNKLIINKFLSLNENIDVVLNNINSVSKMKSILFEITIDTKLITKPYVRASNQQILIAPCSLYFLQSITHNSQYNLWQIKLNLFSQDDSNIQDYLQCFLGKNYITDTYIYALTLYLFEEYQLAIDFLFDKLKVYPKIDYGYIELLQLLSDALLYTSIDNTSSSLFIIWLILKTYKLLHSVNIVDSVLVSAYLTLGNICRRQKLFDQAIFYYEKSKNKMKPGTELGNYDMQISINIGYIHEMMHKYIDALSCYEACSTFLIKNLHIQKSNLIFKKNAKNSGRIQCKLFFYQLKRIEDRYEKNSHRIWCVPDSSLLPKFSNIEEYSKILHRNLLELLVKHYYRSAAFDSRIVAALYIAISNLYAQNGKTLCAINSRKMAIKIRLKSLLSTTNLLLIDYYSIATYYYACHRIGEHHIGTDKQCLKYADYYIKKAIRMQKNIFPRDHIFLAESYNVQAVIYVDFGKYNLALTYFNQTLAIYSKWIANDHEKFSLLYKSIGIVYLHKRNYVKAIEYFQTALVNSSNIMYSSQHNLIQIYKLLTIAYYYLHDTDKAFEQMKTLINVYREKILDKSDPAVEYLKYSIENNRQMTFHQLYQETAGLIHLNYHQNLRLLKFDLEYLLLSAWSINIPLYICVYDEYLFNTDVYFLSLNDTNEDIALVNRIRNYSQAKYFVCYKGFNNITELCNYIQLISEEDGEKIRTVALIIPKRLFDTIYHQTPKQRTLKLFHIDENFTTDFDLQQLVNMIDKWLKLQIGEFKQFIRCEDFVDINTNQNTVKGHGDGMTKKEGNLHN